MLKGPLDVTALAFGLVVASPILNYVCNQVTAFYRG